MFEAKLFLCPKKRGKKRSIGFSVTFDDTSPEFLKRLGSFKVLFCGAGVKAAI